jgi:hypothetical protein
VVFVKKEDDNRAAYVKIWQSIHKDAEKPRVASLVNDLKTGAIAEEFDKFMKETQHESIDVLGFFNECF